MKTNQIMHQIICVQIKLLQLWIKLQKMILISYYFLFLYTICGPCLIINTSWYCVDCLWHIIIYRNYDVSSTSFSRVHVFLSDQDVGVYYLTITLLPSNIYRIKLWFNITSFWGIHVGHVRIRCPFLIKIQILAQHFKETL